MLHWGVYFVVLSIVFNQLGTIEILGFTLNQVLIIVLFVLALFSKLLRKADVYKIALPDILLVLFGGYIWISNFVINDNPTWGFPVCMSYVRALTCYFLVVFLIDTPKKIRLFILTYIAASVAMVFSDNLFSALGTNITFTASARQGLVGLAGHYIQYAIYALMSIPLAFAYFQNSKGRLKVIFVLIMIALALATLFSGSRGAVVSFVIMLIAIIAIMSRTQEQAVSLSIVLVLFMGLGMVGFFLAKGGGTLMGTLHPGGQTLDASLGGRWAFLGAALSLFIEHPIFGIGINAFANTLAFKHVPHNQWLQILAELGLIGFIFSLFLVYSIFRGLVAAHRHALLVQDRIMMNIVSGVGIAIFTLLFTGLYEHTGIIQGEKVLFMLFGIARSLDTILSIKMSPKTYSASPFHGAINKSNIETTINMRNKRRISW